jgi:hypothetical protein
LVGLFLTVLVKGFLAYFLMKTYFLKPAVDKDTASALEQTGIQSDNYQSILNSVRQQVNGVERRMQADADALNKNLR